MTVAVLGPSSFAMLGMGALLVGPVAWASTPVLGAGDSGLPFAGPELLARGRPPGQVGIPRQDRLVSYVLSERDDERFILATQSTGRAAPLILATGEAVMALGGFSGGDPILSRDDLAARVRSGEVRFFLLAESQPTSHAAWVRQVCAPVPAERWRQPAPPPPPAGQAAPGGSPPPAPPGAAQQQLFDCGGARS